MDNCILDELTDRANAKQEMVEKWQKHDLLNKFGVTDPWEQLDFALLLENQRLSNESNYEDIAQFNRISIPLVVRIWKGLITHHIASVQPLFTSDDAFYHLDYDGPQVEMKKTKVATADHKYKAVWCLEGQYRSQNNLDYEAELIAVLSQEICLEIDRRSIHTMLNCARTNWTFDFANTLDNTIMGKYESLYVKSVVLSKKIHETSGRGEANWIVISPEIASVFETAGFNPTSEDVFTSSLGVQYVGTLHNKWSIYKDPLFPTSKMLFGFKGNHPYDRGYFYCPNVMLKQTPTVLDPDSFCPRKGLFGIEAHRLCEGGENLYGTLTITNFI